MSLMHGDFVCDGIWLGHRVELRRDHDVLRALMSVASGSDDAGEAEAALRLTIELFRLHVRAERQVFGMTDLGPSIEYLMVLIEQVESQLDGHAPEDESMMLTLVQLLDEHLRTLMSTERDYYLSVKKQEGHMVPARNPSSDEDLRNARSELLREAEALLGSAIDPV